MGDNKISDERLRAAQKRIDSYHLQGESVPVGHVRRDSSVARMIVNLPEGTPLFAKPQPAELNEVSGNSGELGVQQKAGITAEWVLGYLNTDAPEESRDSIRNAFAEYAGLTGVEQLQGGRVTGWSMIDGTRVFSVSAYSSIIEDQQFVRYDDYLSALAATGKQQVAEVHPDDAAVDAFAVAMKAKMAAARAKGRGGWEDPAQCSADDLSRMLRDHVDKGDPRDVANFCMMLHQRGEAIASRQPVGQEPVAMYQVRPRSFRAGAGWREVDKSEYDGGKSGHYPERDWERRTLYAAPPAQGIYLGQFRRPVQEWRDDMGRWLDANGDYQGAFARDIAEADRLLALIDGRDAGAGVGE